MKAAVVFIFGHEKWLPSSGFFSFLPLGRCNQHYVVGNIYCESEWKEPANPVMWFHRKAGSAFYVWLICLLSFSVVIHRHGFPVCTWDRTTEICTLPYLRILWFVFFLRILGRESTGTHFENHSYLPPIKAIVLHYGSGYIIRLTLARMFCCYAYFLATRKFYIVNIAHSHWYGEFKHSFPMVPFILTSPKMCFYYCAIFQIDIYLFILDAFPKSEQWFIIAKCTAECVDRKGRKPYHGRKATFPYHI